MIGAIAGDIIGSRFEGDRGPHARFKLFHPDCGFTDDTVCVLAVANALLKGSSVARSLRSFVRRHPDRGYGQLFEEWAGDPRAGPYQGWGNGAPMRVAAIGWLATDEAEALELAAAQASVTHDHEEAIAGARAVAVSILRLRQGQSVDVVRTHISTAFQYDLSPEVAFEGGGFDVSAIGTVPPALAAAFEAKSWEGAVRRAVCLGGDTDTLACIAGAVAEALHGVPDAIAAKARTYLTPDLAMVLTKFEGRMRQLEQRDR